MTLKRLDKLLNSGSASPGRETLETLARHANDMDGLAAIIRQALPAADGRQIVSANLRDDGELVVLCQSSAWASRIRFESERLLQAARARGFDARRCRIRVSR